MGDIRVSANASFRDYAVDGVPPSGDHDPLKSDIRATFALVEDKITAAAADIATAILSGGNIYANTTAGLAGVTEGQYFFVPVADGLELFRDLSGVATSQGIVPDTAYMAAIQAAAEAAEAGATAAATASTTVAMDAFGRAGLYGLTGFEAAAVLAVDAEELAFDEAYYRDGLTVETAPAALPDWTFARASAAVAPNTSGGLVSFASGAPRITNAGLLIEPARTNLLLQSNTFTNASWSKNSATLTAGAATGPDGASSASSFFATGAGVPALLQSATLTGADYTFTVYAKMSGTQDWLVVNWLTKGFDNYAWFDLANGVVGTTTGDSVVSIEPSTNGFYRCRVTRPATAGSRLVALGFSDTEGVQGTPTVGQGVYLAFSQIELGADATNPITTTTSTVTRAADVASLAFTPGVSGFLYVEFIAPRVQNVFTAAPLAANVGTPVGFENGAVVSSNGAVQLASGVSAAEGALVRAVLTWDATGRRFYANGAGASDANGVGAITTLSLGNSDGALNSTILAVVAANGVKLTADECVLMTGGSVTPGSFGATTFAASGAATKAVTSTFGGVEKAYTGRQATGDYRPDSGVQAVQGPDGELMELTFYQYGGTIRLTGSQIFEFFIGEDPLSTTDLSLRGKVNNLGSKFNVRNGTDTYGAILAATGDDRVRVGADNGSGVPAEMLIQSGHADGYFPFRNGVDSSGAGGTELGRMTEQGFEGPVRATAPTLTRNDTFIMWCDSSDSYKPKITRRNGTGVTVTQTITSA